MEIAVRKVNEVTVLDVTDALVWGQPTEDFGARIGELLTAGTKNLAINLAKVPYVDSAGIRALFTLHSSVQAAGAKCKLFAAPLGMLRILERVHLDQIFELLADEAAALASF